MNVKLARIITHGNEKLEYDKNKQVFLIMHKIFATFVMFIISAY